MKNTKTIGFLSFFFGVLSALLFAVPGVSVVQAGCDDDDRECQEKELKEEAEKLEKKIKKEQAEASLIAKDLGSINSSLTSTQQLILKVQNLLNQTSQTIAQKEEEITNLEQQLRLERQVLKGLIQEIHFVGNVPLAEFMLSESDLAGLFQESDNLFSTQEKLQQVIQSVNDMKEKVSAEMLSLEDAKEDHEAALALQNKQKQVLVSEKAETEQDLQEVQATVSELQGKLRELEGDLSVLTGKSYDAKDIREAVEFASGKTGVPKGVLYGFLKKETNLGANTGQCTYKEVEKVSVARYKALLKKNKKYQASIDLLYKRQDIFYDIVKVTRGVT